MSLFPIDQIGVMSRGCHFRLIKNMRQKKMSDDSFDLAILPTSCDVLFGKEQGLAELKGNQQFSTFIGANMDAYLQSSKAKKNQLTRYTILMVKNCNGGRFLRRNNNSKWEEVNDETAWIKVGHDLRNRFHY